MLTSGKFLVSFEVPGPLPGTTEGFCEEMNVVYRTEELNTYLRYPKQEINPGHKHSTYIRLKLREILEVNLRYNHNRYNITTMKKKDIIYIPGQDKWSEHFPTPGKLRPSNFGHIFGDTQSQFNKLLRTQQKLRNKKK